MYLDILEYQDIVESLDILDLVYLDIRVIVEQGLQAQVPQDIFLNLPPPVL